MEWLMEIYNLEQDIPAFIEILLDKGIPEEFQELLFEAAREYMQME